MGLARSRASRPQELARPFYFSRFSFASHTTAYVKERLLVVCLLRHFNNKGSLDRATLIGRNSTALCSKGISLRARSFGIFRNRNIFRNIFRLSSAPGSRIAGMEIQVFRNENSSQTNVYSHYSNYYSGLIADERAFSAGFRLPPN